MLRWFYRIADGLRHRARLKYWAGSAAIGRRGEDLAHRYLQGQGMTVVARNYRTPGGSSEADLIAWENDTLAVVEVKTRSSAEFGLPGRNINLRKERKVIGAGEQYASRANVPPEKLRFDVVTVLLGSDGSATIDHFKGAIRRDGYSRW